MKTQIIFTLFGILAFYYTKAQDGSNIRYCEISVIDKTYEGKYCHLDFGQESFLGTNLDTINILIESNIVEFVEHRKDDGYNNWFNEQYLYAFDYDNNWEIRLHNSRIDSVTNENIYLSSTLSYYVGDNPVDTISIVQHSHSRDEISKVLILEDLTQIQSIEPCQNKNSNGRCPYCSSKRKVLKTSPGTIVSYNFGMDSIKYIKAWEKNVKKGYETYTNTNGEIRVINVFIETENDKFWNPCNKWFCKRCKKIF